MEFGEFENKKNETCDACNDHTGDQFDWMLSYPLLPFAFKGQLFAVFYKTVKIVNEKCTAKNQNSVEQGAAY